MEIAVIGYGKMGKLISSEAVAKGHSIGLIIDENNRSELNESSAKNIDVAIEFTGPEAAVDNILRCLDLGIPVVSGSTGWLDQLEKVSRHCKKEDGAFLYSSNFSVGMNIFFKLNKKLAQWMESKPEYVLSLEEIHHTAKKDVPSGTAITLAEGIIEVQSDRMHWKNEADPSTDVVSIISKRERDVPGTHIVEYRSEVDKIKIEHTAFSRLGFVRGAILAAEWLPGKKGIFSMTDVLSF